MVEPKIWRPKNQKELSEALRRCHPRDIVIIPRGTFELEESQTVKGKLRGAKNERT